MDNSEKLAKDYLSRLGFNDIVYEPDNKNPQTFWQAVGLRSRSVD